MAIYSAAKTKLFIGGPKSASYAAPLAASDFTSVTWTKVSPIETIGSFGDSSEEVTFTSIDDSRTRRLKGARDAGVLEVSAGRDYSDAGQEAMLAAEASPNDFAFKIEMNDAPEGGTPSIRYFVGQVMSAQEQVEGVNSILKVVYRIAINSNVVRVNAAGA